MAKNWRYTLFSDIARCLDTTKIRTKSQFSRCVSLQSLNLSDFELQPKTFWLFNQWWVWLWCLQININSIIHQTPWHCRIWTPTRTVVGHGYVLKPRTFCSQAEREQHCLFGDVYQLVLRFVWYRLDIDPYRCEFIAHGIASYRTRFNHTQHPWFGLFFVLIDPIYLYI